MNTRLIVCLALVAMAIPAFANEGHDAGISLGGSVSGSINVQKDLSTAAPAPTANPSAPAVDANKGSHTLSVPVVDVQVKKVPIVTVADAPCQKVCAPKCSVSLERTCNKVPVTQKKCEAVSKPVTKRMCSKKCTVTTPAVEMSKTPVHPNPSAPVAAPSTGAHASLSVSAGVEAKANVQASAAGADMSKSVSVSVGKGSRKLQGLLPVKAMVAKAVLGHAHNNVKCEDVCEDVASTESSIECNNVTTEVERCGFTPKQTCQEQCVCIPMKSVSVALPSKPVSISLDKSTGKGH